MTPVQGADPCFDAVAALVSAQTGLLLSPACRDGIESSARRLMARAGIADQLDYLSRLKTVPSALDELISECTVGETYFFREPSHFDFIRDEAIPALRRLRGVNHVLRFWSAGCASGEEAYSLAILLAEMGLQSQARILATDISKAALSRAETGIYGAWSLRGDAAQRAAPYLRVVGNRFELVASLRRQVEFAQLNLAQDVYPSVATKTAGMDLVLCRNVLIYLDAEPVRAVARRLHASLAAGGFLITGASDPLLSEHAPFETLMSPVGVLYRKRVEPGQDSEMVPAMMQPAAGVGASAAAVAPANPAGPGWPEPKRLLPGPVSVERPPLSAQRPTALDEARADPRADDAAPARQPAPVEVAFLQAARLMSQGDYAEADRALRRVLYLDPTLAVVHFLHGAALQRLGRLADAARSYRNARDIAARRPPEEVLPLADGECASQLAAAAAAQLAALEMAHGPVP